MMRNQRNKRRHPRFILNLLVCSFGFYSLVHNPKFYLTLFFIPLVSHHWNTILYFISVYSLFILFLIIGTPSQVLSKFLLCYFVFSSLRHHHMFYYRLSFCSFHLSSLGCKTRLYLKIIVCSFGFSSLEHHPIFYLNLFFVHLVSHHWNSILGCIQDSSLLLLFLIIRTSF